MLIKLNQSNDVFPTAMHIAIAIKVKKKLIPSQKLLEKQLAIKTKEFKKIVKVGRTHLQDAIPLTLDQAFLIFYQMTNLKKCIIENRSRAQKILII